MSKPMIEPMTEPMIEPDLAEPFDTWRVRRTPQTAQALLQKLEPVRRAALTTYGGPAGATSPTLGSRAKLIMLDALERYDPTRSSMKTFMMSHLQGLRRASVREGRVVSAPEQVLLDSSRLAEATNELSDRLGRDPSDSELADHVGMSLKRIAHVRRLKPSVAEGGLATLEDGMSTPYAPAVDLRGREHSLYEFLYHGADPVDQLIMEHTLGLHGKPRLQNQQLAAKLRLSPGAVSQRKARLQAALHSLSDTLAF